MRARRCTVSGEYHHHHETRFSPPPRGGPRSAARRVRRRHKDGPSPALPRRRALPRPPRNLLRPPPRRRAPLRQRHPAPPTRPPLAPRPSRRSRASPAPPEGLSGAEAVLQAQGFTARSTSDYHPSQTLRVLVGTRTGSGERAFFFVAGHYIGTDAKEPSAQIRWSARRHRSRAGLCPVRRWPGDGALPAEQRQTRAAQPNSPGKQPPVSKAR